MLKRWNRRKKTEKKETSRTTDVMNSPFTFGASEPTRLRITQSPPCARERHMAGRQPLAALLARLARPPVEAHDEKWQPRRTAFCVWWASSLSTLAHVERCGKEGQPERAKDVQTVGKTSHRQIVCRSDQENSVKVVQSESTARRPVMKPDTSQKYRSAAKREWCNIRCNV